MCLCFSLTGDLPFVRSGRQGSVCVCLCFSLTGDLPFVRSGRQGSVYRCVYTFVISTIRHFIYTYAILSQKHQGNRTSEAKKTRV